ncbi:hypothetical protein N8987_06745 [Crocinitomix sp.]|nr:hypothetical protein [Crocinitomix sp.]
MGSTPQSGEGKKNYLAIGLFVSAHSSIISYAFVATRDGKVIEAQTVRKERFMYSAMGYWPSVVNLKRENLFEVNNVHSCFLIKDDYDKIVDFYCPVFDDAWKVRFKENPYRYDEYGWSHGQYKPSQAQAEYLAKEYGIHNVLTDYIYGESLFKFLRDIQDNAWIAAYKALPSDPVVQGP